MTAMIPNESAPRWFAGVQGMDDPYPLASETFATWVEAYDYYVGIFDMHIAWCYLDGNGKLLDVLESARAAVRVLTEGSAMIITISDVEYFLTRIKGTGGRCGE